MTTPYTDTKTNSEASEVESSDLLAAFQYYDGCRCIVDVAEITLQEGLELWGKHLDDFKTRATTSIERDYDTVEMCLWQNMSNEHNYNDKAKYACSSDMKLIDDELYVCTLFIG